MGPVVQFGMNATFARSLVWSEYEQWLHNKYSQTYASNIYRYSKKYHHLFSGSLRELDLLSPYVSDHTVKALTALSKYLGLYQEFRNKLKSYGVKRLRRDAFTSFLRILNNSNGEILPWYRKAINSLRSNERLYLRFVAVTGLRKNEAIQSFNLIIRLYQNTDLKNYYNEELNCLEHFKFKELFLRRTKNTYISFIPKSLILKITNSKPVTYAAIIKRLKRNGLKTRINELRDYYGTFMVKHGLIREEVDLLQGRIPPNVFIRHYWSPSFKELRDRTLKAIDLLQQSF